MVLHHGRHCTDDLDVDGEEAPVIGLPPATRQVLESIRVVVSIGVTAVSTPLECLRLDGYRNLLLFWMMMPAAFVAAIEELALELHRGSSSKTGVPDELLQSSAWSWDIYMDAGSNRIVYRMY